jgi:membrane AbrB-like protein
MSGLEALHLPSVLLTIAVGYLGAFVANRLNLPGGRLLGPMVAVGLMHAVGVPVERLNPNYRYLAQILVGATLASTLTPEVFRRLLALAGPSAVGVLLIVSVGVFGGWVLHLATGLNLATALFAGTPGGAAEMALAAGDLGGSVETVASLHVVRSLTVLLLAPFLLRWILRNRAK